MCIVQAWFAEVLEEVTAAVAIRHGYAIGHARAHSQPVQPRRVVQPGRTRGSSLSQNTILLNGTLAERLHQG